jgi:hypothetical protein
MVNDLSLGIIHQSFVITSYEVFTLSLTYVIRVLRNWLQGQNPSSLTSEHSARHEISLPFIKHEGLLPCSEIPPLVPILGQITHILTRYDF